MGGIDAIVRDVLRELGVDTSKPPHWIIHKHNMIDQTTGKIYHVIDDGYTCSYCGKHSYWRADVCEGCKSVMKGENNG